LLIAIDNNTAISDIQVVRTILYTVTALRRHANKAKLIRAKIEQ